MTQQNFLASSV